MLAFSSKSFFLLWSMSFLLVGGQTIKKEKKVTSSVPVASSPMLYQSNLRALFSSGKVTQLSSTGGFFVSPRWSPDGQYVVVSGKMGRGLFLIEKRQGKIRKLHPSFIGKTYWHSDGILDLHLFPKQPRNSEIVYDLRLDVTSGQMREITKSSRLWIDPESKYLNHILYDKNGLRISYEFYRQRLRGWQGGKLLYQRDDVWGISISPNGQRIAYSKGFLNEGVLYILEKAKERKIGKGVYPSWDPTSHYLVYALPQTQKDAKGVSQLVGSELYLLNTETNKAQQLTITSQRIEMEPVFSPSGSHIAFSDWRSGHIYLFSWGGR